MADIFGVEIADPPEGWTVLDVIVVARAINDDGRETMFTRNSGVWDVLALGMVAVAQRTFADHIAECMEDDDEGDE